MNLAALLGLISDLYQQIQTLQVENQALRARLDGEHERSD
jgi:hypothetical protein